MSAMYIISRHIHTDVFSSGPYFIIPRDLSGFTSWNTVDWLLDLTRCSKRTITFIAIGAYLLFLALRSGRGFNPVDRTLHSPSGWEYIGVA